LSQAISMVGTGALLCLGGAGLDSLFGTGPILFIVFACFGAASIFAYAYYRYAASIQIEEASQPWNRRSEP
jgi:arginine exporter protein ArgO